MSDFPTMDRNAFKGLGRALAAAAAAGGMDASTVRALSPGVAEIADSGVSVFWAGDAFQGTPGWLVRSSYPTPDESAPPVVRTVMSMPEADYREAAKCAALLAVEKAMETAVKAGD